MKTYIKSAGKNPDQDYGWYKYQPNQSQPLTKTPKGPAVANALVKNIPGQTPERLLSDEHFCLFIQYNQNIEEAELKGFLSLLVYLPALPLNKVLEKSYRVDYTGQRPIRNGFAWEAEKREECETLRYRAIGFLLGNWEELTNSLEGCFDFDESSIGFCLKPGEFEQCLKTLDDDWEKYQKEMKSHQGVVPTSGVQYAGDSRDRRLEVCKQLRNPIDSGYLVDRYLSYRELDPYSTKLRAVLSFFDKNENWVKGEQTSTKNPRKQSSRDGLFPNSGGKLIENGRNWFRKLFNTNNQDASKKRATPSGQSRKPDPQSDLIETSATAPDAAENSTVGQDTTEKPATPQGRSGKPDRRSGYNRKTRNPSGRSGKPDRRSGYNRKTRNPSGRSGKLDRRSGYNRKTRNPSGRSGKPDRRSGYNRKTRNPSGRKGKT